MALYLPIQKAIFLHVPKTGGLFIEQFLRQITKVEFLGNRHSHIRMIGRIAYDPSVFKFCFLRNPATWYKSYWQMKMGETPIDTKEKIHWFPLGIGHDRGGVHNFHHPTWDIDPYCGDDDLNIFIHNCLNLNGFLNKLYENFIGWGGARVNFIGEFDRMILDFEQVLNHLKIDYNKKALELRPKYNPSVERQQIDKGLIPRIEKIEDFYFKIKKGFQ